MTQDSGNGLSFYFKVTIEPVGQTPSVEVFHQGSQMGLAARAATPAVPALQPGAASPGSQAAATGTGLETPPQQLARTLVKERRDRQRTYYDKSEDEADRKAYYKGVDLDGDADALFHDFKQLLEKTHKNRLSYKTARLKHLYPWIDLRPHNLELFSIYSDDEMGAERVIGQELAVLARSRSGALESYSVSDLQDWLDDDQDDDDGDPLLEAIRGEHNCEHVVPQSWFDKKQPMKADLHHLFACEMKCNSFRGNIPYFDFDPTLEAERGDCGRRTDGRFEPSYNHGVVARATLYFLLRYPGMIGDEKRELQKSRLDMLLRWHKSQKVDLYELHRNAEIAKVQGNRNPLIDFPDLADRINFRLGFD